MAYQHGELDGVPVLHASGDVALHAGLVFRVGRADETLVRGGITHLIEHLVLHRLGQPDHHINGATGPVTTTFHTSGEPDDVATFFTEVCAALRDLPMDRLETEKAILRTEWSGRTHGVTEPLLPWRYGPVGYALSSYAEFGLADLTPDDLRAWVARWFTRGNAVLWVAGGPPPEKLRLDLPDGPRRPVPVASRALPRTPAYFGTDVNGVGFDAVVERSTAARAYAAVLERRLHAVLRRDLGISYAAWSDYSPRDGDTAVVTAFADALPDRLDDITVPFVDVLIDLAAGDIPADDLAAVRSTAESALRNPLAPAAAVPQAAHTLITGGQVTEHEDLLTEIRQLSTDDVRQAAREALGGALLMTPPGQRLGRGGFVAAPEGSLHRVQGRSVRSVDHPLDRTELVLGSDGVTMVAPDRSTVATVLYADCVGMLRWPDGRRVLFAPDAVTVTIESRLWRLPAGALDAIDAAVPADRVVQLPERKPETIPNPRTTRWQRARGRAEPPLRRAAARFGTGVGKGLLVALAIAVPLLLVLYLSDSVLVPAFAALMGVVIASAIRSFRRTRRR